jgi:hypothetical protein
VRPPATAYDHFTRCLLTLCDVCGVFQDLPSSATLSQAVGAVGAAAAAGDTVEAGGWLRPLEFKPEQHR